MGNLGKVKRKQKKVVDNHLHTYIRNLSKDELIIFKRLYLKYVELLKDKELEKIESMIRWGVENKDPMVLEAINFTHQGVAKKLNISYQFLSKQKSLRFLMDNPQYIDLWLKGDKNISTNETETELDPKVKKLFDKESDDLLEEYLTSIEILNKEF